ncbi:MAG: DNA polymerase I [Candidatus Omnitrophota bacterium]
MKRKRVFLIDGNSFCYRAFYAIRTLSNSKGQPTNAVYGVVSMINKIVREENLDVLAVAFDMKGFTFRHKMYEDYKVHRKPMPDDLISQIPVIKNVISAYNIPIFETEGYEADDVIATLAKRAEKEGYDVYIVTGDKDALQLVGDHVRVYNPQKDKIVYDSETVEAKFGVRPSQITDLLAIMGDASDNIPGVKGLGDKGARELIREYGSIENLMDRLDTVKSAARRKLLEEGRESAVLSKRLATVKTDVPIKTDFDKLVNREPDREMLAELFKELEFRTLLKDLTPARKLEASYRMIGTAAELAKLAADMEKTGEIALDFETTDRDPMAAEPVGISFSWETGSACYVPFNVKKETGASRAFAALKCALESKSVRKIGQNIKYEYIILKRNGITLAGIDFDTMIASYVLDPQKTAHSLDDLAAERLNHRMTPITDLIGKGKDAVTMDKVEPGRVMKYCCEDSDVTLRLKNILEKELIEKGLDGLFRDLEMPLLEVLAGMEMSGILIDTDYLEGMSRDMAGKLAVHEKRIYELAGEEFNVNSPKQLQGILFGKLKMPVIRRTKTGASTDEGVLRNLAEKYELPREMLKYREYSKLKSTYVDALPNLVNRGTGKVHTSFNQTVTATGRLSSSNPNLQNIPVKTEEGRKIRRAFLPDAGGSILLSADYSQIELRLLAHLSQDENLIRAFNAGRDIHAYTASLIYGVDEKDVTREMRDSAKTVNFGIIYGMSAFGLSRELGIGIEAAGAFIDNYFNRYPGVKVYLEEKVMEARKRKYVTTIMQRRRYIPEIASENQNVRNFAERTAINAPIQGSAADMIKLAMISIYGRLSGMKSRMILQVHDELVFNVAPKELEAVASMVKERMENVVHLSVPVSVNVKTGKNWLDMEAYTA